MFYNIDLLTTRHKVVHNGGSPNFKGSLFNKKTTYMAQILQSLSYKVCFIILPKFNKFGLLIPVLGTSTTMYQMACCYNMTTSEIGLYRTNAAQHDATCRNSSQVIKLRYVFVAVSMSFTVML